MKPHAWRLWLVVALLGTAGALVVSRGWAEETHTVKPKDTGKVEKNFDIDKNDEEIVNPESVVGEGKITITTKTFKHPTGWKFKKFTRDLTPTAPHDRRPFNPGQYIDIEIDPQCLPPVVDAPTVQVNGPLPARENPDAIKVVVTDLTVPLTVGWPLKCEGNLEPPPRGGGRGGGGGAKKEWHWSAMITDECGAVLRSLTFVSDFTRASQTNCAYLWNKSDTWDAPTTAKNKIYSEPEWEPSHSWPVAHKQNGNVVVEVVVEVGTDKPRAISYTLTGVSDVGYLHFAASGTWPSPGSGMHVVQITSAEKLPDSVGVLRDKQIRWTLEANAKVLDLGETGPHTLYLTYDVPSDMFTTIARLDGTDSTDGKGCCDWAAGTNAPEGIADALWNNLNAPNDPPFEPNDVGVTAKVVEPGPFEGISWRLLNGLPLGGDCTTQASLMIHACRQLGVPAELLKIRASYLAGAENCTLTTTYWTRPSVIRPGETEILFLDADSGPGYNWQNWEACCSAAGKLYAVFPAYKADDAYRMLKDGLLGQEGWQQHWIIRDAAGFAWVMEENVPLP